MKIIIIIFLILLFIAILGGIVADVMPLLVIFGVPVIIFVVYKLHEKNRAREAMEWQMREAKAEQNRYAQEREMKKQNQQTLIRQYANSDLLKEILNALSEGDYTRVHPEQIFVYNNRIESKVNGRMVTYDFISHRVPTLEFACGSCDSIDDEQFIVRPQVAIAEAINQLMGYEYDILDGAERKDNGLYGDEFYYIYSSNFVEMRLKAKRSF